MMTNTPAPTADPAFQKLVNVLGRERAQTVVNETMRAIGVSKLVTADDRYRFACELMKRGGVLEAVGRAVKIQAILHGAKDTG